MSTNRNIHFTLVGSNIHDSFVDALKSKPEDYAYTAVSSFAEYKPPAGAEAHVIVLHGHDDELAKTTTVAQLLDQPIILAFFAPSKDVLDALQDASKSLVHIPSIELEDGAPIIINRRPDDGVISLVPGFTAPTESVTVTEDVEVAGEETGDSVPAPLITTAAPTPDEKLAMNYANSVNLIQLTVEHHLELLHLDGTQGLPDGDHLRPPPGIQFYKVIDLGPLTFDSIPSTFDNQHFKYVYRVRVHAYCANAKPTDKDFEKNGGEVHVVAVLDGEVFRDPNYKPRIHSSRVMAWFLDAASFHVHPRPGESALTPKQGEPWHSKNDGLDTRYYTDFGTTLNMWNPSISSWVPFFATYKGMFIRNQFKQNMQKQAGGFDMLIYYDNYYDKSIGNVPYEGAKGWKNVFDKDNRIKPFPEDKIPLYGLFHWRTSKLRSHTIDIFGGLNYVHFRVSGRRRYQTSSGHPQSHTLDLSASSWN